MKDFFDLFSSIKENIQNGPIERSRKPFFSAYIISFLIYNWELFYFLLMTKENLLWMDKIIILKNKIDSVSKLERIGVPVLMAFTTIFFFYLFSYTSKALYMLFSRWYDNTLLTKFGLMLPHSHEHLKDIEAEKETLRRMYEPIKRERNELYIEIEKKNNDAKKYEEEYRKIMEDNLNKDKKIIDLETSIKNNEIEKYKIKVCFAKYYTSNNYVNVLSEVVGLLNNQNILSIANSNFPDPEKYVIKKFMIGFVIDDQYREIELIEGEILKKSDQGFEVLKTSEGNKNISIKKGISEFYKKFKGVYYFYSIVNTKKEIYSVYFTEDGHLMIDNTNKKIFTILEAKELDEGYSLRIIGDGNFAAPKTNESIFLSPKIHLENKINLNKREYYINNNPFIFKGNYVLKS